MMTLIVMVLCSECICECQVRTDKFPYMKHSIREQEEEEDMLLGYAKTPQSKVRKQFTEPNGN